MNTVIFYASDSNDEFRREAIRLSKLYDSLLVAVSCADNEDRHTRRQKVLTTLADVKEIRFLAFLCHGWKQGIQLGFDLTNISQLASAIRNCAQNTLSVALYCCSTGGGGPDGDGGFADALRDASGLAVNAHDGAGHTTRRPYVRRFDAGLPGKGGEWLIPQNSPYWSKWYKALKGDTELRFRYPLMTREEITSYLQTQ